jgi:preprotein translocase subunit SecY
MAASATRYLTGFLAMLGSLAVILVLNRWVADWTVIVTMLAWIGLAKGAARLAMPQLLRWLGEQIAVRRGVVAITTVIILRLGLALTWFGYR